MVVGYLLYFGIYFLNQELPIGRDSIFHSICSPRGPKRTSDEAATLSSPVGWLADLAQQHRWDLVAASLLLWSTALNSTLCGSSLEKKIRARGDLFSRALREWGVAKELKEKPNSESHAWFAKSKGQRKPGQFCEFLGLLFQRDSWGVSSQKKPREMAAW